MDSMAFQKLNKLFVVGDFDGDGIRDTVFQHTVSLRTGKEIVHTPDPFQHEWDNMVKWFDDQEAEVYLTMNIQNPDTLHLGFAQGLYGLINVGDNNADGRDEIALVIDHLDFSAVNSCKIFSLCKGQWTLLKQFGVLEDAFVLTDEQAHAFDQIAGFLENRNGKWMYRDYLPQEDVDQDGDENLAVLILDKCK